MRIDAITPHFVAVVYQKHSNMKGLLVSISILLLAILVNSFSSSKMSGASVSATKMNVLYMGVDNPINIAVWNKDTSEVYVTMSNGDVTRSADGKYMATANKPGKATIEVRDKQSETLLYEAAFRVKRIPVPKAVLGGRYSGGYLPANVIKRQKGMVAVLECFAFDMSIKIVSFKVSFMKKDGPKEVVSNKGPAFNGRILELIGDAVAGDTVFFYEIRAQLPAHSGRMLAPVTYLVL